MNDILKENIEQQSTIKQLKEENSNLNSIINEVGLQKPFIKILDDYMIEYDGSCFSMHKPSDIRSFVYLMNRNNNFDELQCEYNDESMVIDDEPFKFNKNCAKPYEIRSISPNGVIRVGKKNSKVSWRMKDVREISRELPPFEDFNRGEYQKIRNKFAPKLGGGDLIGRIIWNIYNGTFCDYI